MPDADKATQIVIAYADTCFQAADEFRKELAKRMQGAPIEPSQKDSNDLTILTMALVWSLHDHYGLSWDTIGHGIAEAIKLTVMMAHKMGELSVGKEHTP